MNEFSNPGAGKITVHGNGLGVPSREEVEKRAREIALIDERDPNDFTEADWQQARREIMGDHSQSAPEEDAQNAKMEKEWEVTPDDRGRRVPRPGIEDDEQSLGEQIVGEGVEEAAHDQMLEA